MIINDYAILRGKNNQYWDWSVEIARNNAQIIECAGRLKQSTYEWEEGSLNQLRQLNGSFADLKDMIERFISNKVNHSYVESIDHHYDGKLISPRCF